MGSTSIFGVAGKLLGGIYQVGAVASSGCIVWTINENVNKIKRVEREDNTDVEVRSDWYLRLYSVPHAAVGSVAWLGIPYLPHNHMAFIPIPHLMTPTEKRAYLKILDNTRRNDLSSEQFLLPNFVKGSLRNLDDIIKNNS